MPTPTENGNTSVYTYLHRYIVGDHRPPTWPIGRLADWPRPINRYGNQIKIMQNSLITTATTRRV